MTNVSLCYTPDMHDVACGFLSVGVYDQVFGKERLNITKNIVKERIVERGQGAPSGSGESQGTGDFPSGSGDKDFHPYTEAELLLLDKAELSEEELARNFEVDWVHQGDDVLRGPDAAGANAGARLEVGGERTGGGRTTGGGKTRAEGARLEVGADGSVAEGGSVGRTKRGEHDFPHVTSAKDGKPHVTFAEQLDAHDFTVVNFYAEDCNTPGGGCHSKNFLPDWDRFEQTMDEDKVLTMVGIVVFDFVPTFC